MTVTLSFCARQQNCSDDEISFISTDDILWKEKLAFNDTSYIRLCRCVSLEVTKESLIAQISRIYLYDDNFYIYDDNVSQVLRFNEDGKFVCKYGHKGNGPGEYVALSGFYVDPYRKEVALFDQMAGKVHRFNLDGTFISSVSSSEGRLFTYLGQCEMLNSEDIICQIVSNRTNTYNCVVLNRGDYSIKRVLSEHFVKSRLGEVLNNSVYSISDNEISCVKLFSDTIMLFKGEDVRYEILSHTLSEMPLKMIQRRIEKDGFINTWINAWKNNKYSAGLTSIFETPRWRYIEFPYQDDLHSALLTDKTTGRNITVSGVSSTFFWDLRDIAGHGDNTFIKVLNPSFFEKAPIDKLWEDSPQGWDEVASSSCPQDNNPILILYEMQN
ncbi:MAG: 6-bladed beta-propeller [Porphyromonadaceae bacterium]|nr:6-bladed beta-propeller [Porphyromonadaceae bacterium]